MYRTGRLAARGIELKNATGGDVTEEDLKKLGGELKTATDEVKKFAEAAQTEIKNLGSLTTETKAKADEGLMKMNELSAKHTELSTRLLELEQKSVRRGGNERQELK